MTTFTIRLDAQDAVASAALRTVLASVPARFRVTTEQHADVVVLAGVQPDWTRRLGTAIAAGIRGVLIVRPGPANSDEVRELARRAAPEATLVGVDVGFAADRAWNTALPQIKADAPAATLLDSVVTFDGVSPVTALVEQLAAVRGILPALEPLEAAHRSDNQYVVSGRAESVAVSLTGLRSPLSGYELSLNMVGPQQRWRVRIGGDEVARPSELVRFDGAGAHTQPVLYESPHRAALLALHAALTDGSPLAYTLADLADGLDMAAAIGPLTRGRVLS
jgi:hypothetical protein